MATRRKFLSLFTLLGAAGLAESAADAAMRRCRRWSFGDARCGSAYKSSAASTRKAEFIQPDYAKWRKVKIDMHRDDVLELLGQPLYRQDRDPNFLDILGDFPDRDSEDVSVLSYYWEFGHLEFADPGVPSGAFTFSVSFQFTTHKVDEISDPFHGQLSKNYLPSVPRLMLPQDGSEWSHFPRFLDLRWEPSSGHYPIRYEIESAFAQYIGAGSQLSLDYVAEPLGTSNSPHHTISFGGAQKGRWRVRAQNRLGRSEWSEYRYFEFTV